MISFNKELSLSFVSVKNKTHDFMKEICLMLCFSEELSLCYVSVKNLGFTGEVKYECEALGRTKWKHGLLSFSYDKGWTLAVFFDCQSSHKPVFSVKVCSTFTACNYNLSVSVCLRFCISCLAFKYLNIICDSY